MFRPRAVEGRKHPPFKNYPCCDSPHFRYQGISRVLTTMVRQNIPTILRIDRGELRPTVIARVNPALPELGIFLGLFTQDSFKAAKVAERVAALGAWSEPVIEDLDNEHQFEGPAPWGIETDRPSDSLWKLYCGSLSRRYPNRSPLIISNPISLEDLPTTFLNSEIRQRLPQCSNLLFILRSNLYEFWFVDLDFHTTTLHILTPWPASAVPVPDILLSYGGLEQFLRVAIRDPACRITLAQNYSISTPPHAIDHSWRYVLRAMTLWHETSNPSDFWPRPATPIDSEGWGIPGFMGRLTETLYQQQNENPEGPIEEPQASGTVLVDMPQEVAQVLLGLTRHVKAIEFAQREIDNGAEGILFSGIPSTLDDECSTEGNMMADIVLAGHAERFRRQMDTHPPGASAELIAANRVATELQWNRGINKFIIALDENGQGFIKGLELPPRVHQNYMSTCVNSTNIFNARPSSAILPNFAYLVIDNQPPIFWFQRRRPDLGQEDRIMSTSKHNFYGPTPWVIQEPLCTEAIALSTPANLPPITGIIRLLGNDLNFTPAMVAARATRFGQWSLENYTTDDFDREENLQPTPRLPDPRGLEPTGWLTSDIMDAVMTHYNQFHPEAEIFSVSLTALLVVTGDPSHLAQTRLGARFWIFIQSNVQANHPGNHWWISIVDRVKGHLFSHNSLRDLGDPSILFDVLKPIFESPVVQNIAGSAAILTLPANTVVDVPQQQNG
ncbi:hypothetical protein HOY82DRAFT_643025 [Tuber indicum]|nr:hypothetical protein HOY82DRAFT_643025 [Tuber indicum]